MDTIVAQQLESSIVRILSDSGRVVGAGFLAAERTILTCTHVVAQALGIQISSMPESDIHVDFPFVKPVQRYTVRVVHWRPAQADGGGDIAVLLLTSDQPVGARPALLVTARPVWGHPFRAIGFPVNHDIGVWSSGVFRGPQANGWIHIEDIKTSGYRIEGGFSGGAVWDEQLQAVIGMIVAAEQNPEVRAAFVIPTDILCEEWPDLRTTVIPLDTSDPHERYRRDFARALQKYFPPPEVEFRITFDNGRDVDELLNQVLEEKRFLLRGAAGSGKSSILGKVARLALERSVVPVLINLKEWTREHSTQLLQETTRGEEPELDSLLKVSITDLNQAMLNKFPRHISRLILVDALNEVSGEPATKQMLDLLSEYVRLTAPFTSILVTDRMSPERTPETRWVIGTLDPLNVDEVHRWIDPELPATAREGLSATDQELLRIPYFLNYALKSKNTRLRSTVNALQLFFTDLIRLDKLALDSLAEAAFKAYSEQLSSSFPIAPFMQVIGTDLFEKIQREGILKILDNERAQFDHQLKHDYLASQHLARKGSALWQAKAFDALTFESNSIEPLSMTLAQLADTTQGDQFLERVYNWNWLAALTCLAQSEQADSKHYSREIEIAVVANVTEKRFDPVRWTQTRAGKVLAMLSVAVAEPFITADTIEDVFTFVQTIDSQEEWFVKWRTLFLRCPGPPLKENEIGMIASKNSLLGWTAANVIRRFRLKQADYRQIRAIYHSFDEDEARDHAARWRVVHVLGAFDTEENVRLLLQILDQENYYWVRYGATRSLVEIAARTEKARLRRLVIAELTRRVEQLKTEAQPRYQKALEVIGQTIFYRNAPVSWEAEVTPLVELAITVQQREADRKRWLQLLDDFREFCRGLP